MNINANPEDARLTSGKNISYWTDSVQHAVQHPLSENIETEVVIVGGGLAGLSVAYCLSQTGMKVVVVEDGDIGSGETGRTTAHLVTCLDDRYYHLEKVFGKEKTQLIAESHQLAIEFVQRTVRKEKIDCRFECLDGYLFLHPSDNKDSLEREYLAAIAAGVRVVTVDEVPGLLHKQKALRFMAQAQFHPLEYLQGLCKAITENGGKVYTGTHATDIDHEGITTSDGFTVKAKHIVVATNSPVNNRFTMFEKEYAYRTYVIGALVKKDLLPKALWWDTGDFESNPKVPPYHYIRWHPYNDQYDLLVSGGEDHPTGDTSKTEIAEEDRYRLVEAWTRKNFPIEEVVYQWSGQILEPMDGIAFIGRNPYDRDNVYIVTGDSGNGMTHCSFAGLLITDLINGRENKWEELYSPSRFTLKESAPAFKHLINDSLSLLKEMLTFNGSEELSTVAIGEGKIMSLQNDPFGVYRDVTGGLNIVSAKCTHLKCGVKWNADELSWDCPCHGSRFTYEGKVINGPANFDLDAYHYDEINNQVTKI